MNSYDDAYYEREFGSSPRDKAATARSRRFGVLFLLTALTFGFAAYLLLAASNVNLRDGSTAQCASILARPTSDGVRAERYDSLCAQQRTRRLAFVGLLVVLGSGLAKATGAAARIDD